MCFVYLQCTSTCMHYTHVHVHVHVYGLIQCTTEVAKLHENMLCVFTMYKYMHALHTCTCCKIEQQQHEDSLPAYLLLDYTILYTCCRSSVFSEVHVLHVFTCTVCIYMYTCTMYIHECYTCMRKTPTLPVTPAQLMRPGIGRNVSTVH